MTAPLTSDELSLIRTRLSTERTMMAADRSLMAWVRTGLAMISFGFTIYKLLEGFQAAGGVLGSSHMPRTVGLFLVGLGTVAILLGTVEYWQRLQELRKHQPFRLWRPTFSMAAIMSTAGVFMFVGIVSMLL